jgi:hypothetical protein
LVKLQFAFQLPMPKKKTKEKIKFHLSEIAFLHTIM